MAITFNKKSWKSRISEHPTRRRLTIVDASLGYSLVDVARDEGNIEQVGDTFDKSTMDDLENRIENIAITAQAECDGIQTEIDNLPSLDETKRVDIGYKETGMNENGGSVRVNPFEIFSGTVGTRIGKNLFNKDDSSLILTGYMSDYQYKTATGNVKTICLPVNSNTTYTVSKVQSSRFAVASCPSIPTNNSPVNNYATYYAGTNLTLTTGSSDHYLLAYIYSSQYDTLTLNEILDTVQIEVGSSATSYEPYTESIVINGFIPSARFIEVGRKYMQEAFVTNHPYELNSYHKGYILQHGTTDKWISSEDSDGKINSIWTQYGYDTEEQEFLESVAGEIYTATGAIPVEFEVSDIWMCGANGFSGTGIPSSPSREVNRLVTNANGFPIELKPTNQSAVASLVVGSPVQFRITGTLWIVLEYDLLRDKDISQDDSKFYDFTVGTDTRDGVHYAKHYIDVELNSTFNLSTVTTLTNYHFLQASVDDPDLLRYIDWTVTDSNIAITGLVTVSNIVLHIEHRKDGETEPDYDTAEDIIINVI